MATASQFKLASPPTIYSDTFLRDARIGNILAKQQQILNTKKIQILDPPIDLTDATNKAYVDSVSGGNPSIPNNSVQFNNNGAFGGSSNLIWSGTSLNTTDISANKVILNNPPINVNDATNKGYVDSLINTPGGISTNVQFNQGGVFAGSNDFIWNDFTKFLFVNGMITLPNAPINPTDATNKAYVDSIVIPSAPDTSVQFNNGGSFSGSSDFTWNNGTKDLYVNGTVTLPNIPVNSTDAANKAYVDAATGSAPGGPAQAIQFNSNPAGVFTGTNDFTWDNINKIQSVNGNIVANGFITASDIKFKTNVCSIENPLEILNKIDGYSYNLNNSSKKTFGVIAQDIQQIEEVSDIVNEANGFKAVDYQQFVPLLIESVKKMYKEMKGEIKGEMKGEIKGDTQQSFKPLVQPPLQNPPLPKQLQTPLVPFKPFKPVEKTETIRKTERKRKTSSRRSRRR